MKIKSYSVWEPVKGICKQHAVWIKNENSSNSFFPLIYLQRPKWLKDDVAWEKICKSIRLDIPEDFEINVEDKQQS